MKPIDYVNTLQGTDSCYEYSHGNCLPLIARPWGMTSWTPQTDESNWIFTYNAKRLQGIRATHQPSPWMGDYGNFTIMPQTGRLIIGAKSRESAYKKEESFFSPYYFKTLLIRYQTHLEMTSTESEEFLIISPVTLLCLLINLLKIMGYLIIIMK